MTLKLTDSHQWQVIRATNPLDMLQRDAFLAALLQQFAGRTEIGDGELFRTLRELQASTSGRPRRPSSSQIPSDGRSLELRGDPHLRWRDVDARGAVAESIALLLPYLTHSRTNFWR